MRCNRQYIGGELKSAEKLIVLFTGPLIKLNKTKTINWDYQKCCLALNPPYFVGRKVFRAENGAKRV